MDNETDQENDFVEKETISKTKISYYHVYQKITKQQALNDIASTTNSQNVNQMYNEDGAFFTMLDDYIAFILVWSKILYHKDSTKHVSNAIIENHNKTIKKTWLIHEKKPRPAKYIRKTINIIYQRW